MYDYKQKQELLKDPSIATRPQDLTRKYYYRCRKYDDVTKMQYLDINMWMVGDILLKADRMSMANSLELRVPFLDKEVFKVASSLPTKLRCNKHNTKYAMRKAAVRHMPEATAEKEKLGFPVPTRVWLRDEKYYNVVKTKFRAKLPRNSSIQMFLFHGSTVISAEKKITADEFGQFMCSSYGMISILMRTAKRLKSL